MKILNESSFLKDASIKIIENKMNATYVFESCLKNKYGGWVNFPVAVFLYRTGSSPRFELVWILYI